MKAMVFNHPDEPLELRELPIPQPSEYQVRIRVSACGVCRTDQHIIEGDLDKPKIDLILGHEIVGYVDQIGAKVSQIKVGQRIGVPWLATSCKHCEFCQRGQENLCHKAQFTGYHVDGGYAEYTLAHELACYQLPDGYSDTSLAPLMCAGLIGYRSYQMAGKCHRIGLYGFGAAAHIICQIAVNQGVEVFAFTRPGDNAAQELALNLGAVWAGDSSESLRDKLDAAIIYAPVGDLVPQALRQLKRGGKVICAGIHMSPIPQFNYEILWGERSICSVANLTRQDGLDFLGIAGQLPIHIQTRVFPLQQANEAILLLQTGKLTGAAVLSIPD